jgi:hypothetical protein
MDGDSVVRDWDRPEQAIGVRVDSRVKVVNLGRKIDEVKLTSIEVYSDELKRPLVHLPIVADVFPLHEAHVSVIQ